MSDVALELAEASARSAFRAGDAAEKAAAAAFTAASSLEAAAALSSLPPLEASDLAELRKD